MLVGCGGGRLSYSVRSFLRADLRVACPRGLQQAGSQGRPGVQVSVQGGRRGFAQTALLSVGTYKRQNPHLPKEFVVRKHLTKAGSILVELNSERNINMNLTPIVVEWLSRHTNVASIIPPPQDKKGR